MSEKHIFSTLNGQHNFLNVKGKALGAIESSGVAVAIYSDEDSSLIFYYCQDVPKIGELFCGKTVTCVYEDFDSIDEPSKDSVPWDEIRDNVKSVSFNTSFSIVRPVSTSFWFCYMNNCEKIDLTNLNTSKTTVMQQMFRACPLITSLDLSGMNIDNVIRTSNIMLDCSALEELNVSGWNTSNMLYMNAFVRSCSSLKTIYATQDFIISEDLQNDANMFYDCVSLVGGNGTVFDSSKVNSSMAHVDKDDNPGYFTAL